MKNGEPEHKIENRSVKVKKVKQDSEKDEVGLERESQGMHPNENRQG
jgi:hypothetical protein